MKSSNTVESKICLSCGREMTYRKKWEKNWDEVKYCSDECRRNKNKYDFRETILNALNQATTKSILSVEDVIKTLDSTTPDTVEHIRRSVRLLYHEKKIEVLQNNKIIDGGNFKGAISFRLLKK